MLEILPWRILRETRRFKKTIILSFAELEFLAKTDELTDSAKVLWFILALCSVENPRLIATTTYAALALKINKSCLEIYKLLSLLNVMGFIQVETLPKSYHEEIFPNQCHKSFTISLSFSLKGLLCLKKTARIDDEGENVKVNGKYQRPQILINLLKNKEETQK